MKIKGNGLGIMLTGYRKKAGLTQHDLAKAFNYSSPQFVSNWERGICRPPVKTLAKLTRKLKVPVKEMKGLLIAEYGKELDQVFNGRS